MPLLPMLPPAIPHVRPAVQDRPTLLVFGADWCGWCKKMDADTFTDPRVQAKLKEYKVIHVDGDKDRAAVRRYGITAYPTLVLLDAKNRIVKQEAGYKDAATLLFWLGAK